MAGNVVKLVKFGGETLRHGAVSTHPSAPCSARRFGILGILPAPFALRMRREAARSRIWCSACSMSVAEGRKDGLLHTAACVQHGVTASLKRNHTYLGASCHLCNDRRRDREGRVDPLDAIFAPSRSTGALTSDTGRSQLTGNGRRHPTLSWRWQRRKPPGRTPRPIGGAQRL